MYSRLIRGGGGSKTGLGYNVSVAGEDGHQYGAPAGLRVALFYSAIILPLPKGS